MENKTVLITGGNKGIGLSTTEKFVDAGYAVIVVARNFDNFKFNGHSRVKTIKFDLVNVAGIPGLIAQLPAVDILINNAGVMYALPYDNYPQGKVDELLKINIEAPVALIREVSKTMMAKSVIRISGMASPRPG